MTTKNETKIASSVNMIRRHLKKMGVVIPMNTVEKKDLVEIGQGNPKKGFKMYWEKNNQKQRYTFDIEKRCLYRHLNESYINAIRVNGKKRFLLEDGTYETLEQFNARVDSNLGVAMGFGFI